MYDKIIECPSTIQEVRKLPSTVTVAILRQNQMIAEDMYCYWVAEASKEAREHSNEDAYAYLFKMRRDELLTIANSQIIYTWRKRNIATRVLSIMGYDVEDLVEVL